MKYLYSAAITNPIGDKPGIDIRHKDRSIPVSLITLSIREDGKYLLTLDSCEGVTSEVVLFKTQT
jgi:hypothetical protein